ncbi:MAG: Unknown protein [uncultured Aureispira sp.]|uniref:Secretion system C-terminal sorting domain-containing protein n=1 Tax=uncultured Aureispira sp. TaxID=1331704 RepID=A0A6S6SA61_9BACT|nr:MAG: Unknown protein [uncultured Aureispira sp.]
MVKINLMRFAALAFTVFFMGTSADAQTKIWGVGSTTGVADAEFSTPFTNATSYTAGDNATTWTALTVNENGGATIPGNAYWVRSLTGYSAGGYAGTTPLASPSQVNGIAIFDSDFLDNAGVSGAFGTGTSPTVHRGELISPRIDLTGYADSALTIQFFTRYREFAVTELSISISVDDGQTWVATNDFRGSVSDDVADFARVLFANATAGVANLSQCRIRFAFDGDYYYASVDDVTIEVAPSYDIAIGGPETGSTLLIGSGNTAKIGGNSYNALNNIVHANDLREWFWGAKAINLGAVDLLPSDSAAIYVSIDFTDALSGAVTTDVYVDTMYFDSLVAGDISGQTQIDYLNDLNFMNTYGAGQYAVTYWVAHKNADGNTANDTSMHTFTITDDTAPLTNYISKAQLSIDGGVFSSRGIFPGGAPFSSWEYGSVYFFPRGESDTITIDSVSFRYRLTNGFSGAANQTLFCNVYELDPSAGVLDDGTLLTQVGIGTISLSGLGTTVAAGDYGLTTVTGFIDAAGAGAMAGLKDNGFYYVSILTNPGLTGGIASFGSDDVPLIGGDDGINYYMNSALTRADSVINPSPINVTDAAGSSTWYWTGFGSDVVPSIGLFLGVKPEVPLSVSTVYASTGATFNVYPNPASDVLNFNFEAEEATDVMYILTDITGRVLNVSQSSNVTNDTQSMDVSTLTAGVYLLTAKSADKNWTEKVVID